MKIVIDARESGTSTGRYIDKLAEYLHKLQPAHEITLLTKPHRVQFMKSLVPGFSVIESPYKEFTFSEQLGFKNQLESLAPDLVHFGMVQQPVLYKGRTVTTMHDLTTLRFRNPAKNPLVFTVKQQIYKWVNKKVARNSAHIIVPTEFVKHDVIKYAGISADKITVTYESADKITQNAELFNAAEDKLFLLYVGRAQPHKNLKRLLEAYGRVQKNHPDLHLVLAGKFDSAYQQLEAAAKQQGLESVIFTDWVDDAQLRWLYENAVAYIFPSLSEGFGLPGLEAMQYGVPVISSNATCLPEVYGDAATYFDPLDIESITTAISKVIDNDKFRSDLTDKGYKQVSKYSWQRMAQQTLEVYEQALLNSHKH